MPGKFLAGCYPGAKQPRLAQKRLLSILDAGIRCIINLMEDYETDWKGEEIRHYEEEIQTLAATKFINLECISMPIPETSIPTIAGMKRILDKIDQSIDGGKPVYLHCWGGKGRTGAVVGCYLVRRGIAIGKDALTVVGDLRKNDVARNEPSPENERQRWMICSWEKGE